MNDQKVIDPDMAFFNYTRTTPFVDSDAAGIIHFSKIAVYAEEAEHAFLTQAGYPIELNNANALRWPRVKYQANYIRPIFPFQKIHICLQPAKVGNSSITWLWGIHDFASNELCCNGEMKTVCTILKEKKLQVVPLPHNLRKKLFSA